MLVQILVDNLGSWILPFAMELRDRLVREGNNALVIHDPKEVGKGDVLCLLGCEAIFKELHLNTHNLVVHESGLPKGKGWSPLSWQVLHGEREIPVTLFEADVKIDAGVIYGQEVIKLKGTELVDELRAAQGKATVNLIMNFISAYPNVKGVEQVGESTYYDKRTASDSRLDIDKSIREQFNLLRIVDNERYPAYFEFEGIKYKVSISKFKK